MRQQGTAVWSPKLGAYQYVVCTLRMSARYAANTRVTSACRSASPTCPQPPPGA